jgi:hypothetical protein
VISGSDFSEASACPAAAGCVRATLFGVFTAARNRVGSKELRDCAIVPGAAGHAHTRIACVVPAGIGKDLPPVVSVGNQASAPALFRFDPPRVTDVIPPRPDARGQDIVLLGANFGGLQSPVEVRLSRWIAESSYVKKAPILTAVQSPEAGVSTVWA